MTDDKIAANVRAKADALSVAMSEAGQAGLRCSVKFNGASATEMPDGRGRQIDWYKPNVTISREEFL